ncbi:hypothetical protein L1D31_22215 [Vibrio sp. Isolate23]|uniref:RHS repeat domain-containing protein n=1 Tax=Vibrio sp. Isolate23 TaxID=2908533 RepID=UPI001EFCA65A|nr:hypothetical protein [Vibrio sp. Isolate23]MCG9685235.1 hypothetical protein [Vibrio sp. Isolate23]
MVNNITSNANNFSSFLEAGVDQRTGTFSANIYLGSFNSHAGSGPTFELKLNYNQGSSLDTGFGSGWNLPTGAYNPNSSPKTIRMTSGQTFNLQYDYGIEKYIIPYRKMRDIEVQEDEVNSELVVWKKGGGCEVYCTEYGYLKRVGTPNGLFVYFTFKAYNYEYVLEKVEDGQGQSVIFNYWQDPYFVSIKHFVNEQLVRNIGIDKIGHGQSAYRLEKALQFDSSDNILNITQFEYGIDNFTSGDFISRVVHPTGLVDELEYNDYHLTPPGSPFEKVRRVSQWKRVSGEGQPDIVTTYEYSNENYLGNGSGRNYQHGIDTLFESTSDYEYQSTAIVNGSKSIMKRYNKYHGNHYTAWSENGNLKQEENIVFYADLSQGIEEQPAQYTCIKEKHVSFHNNENSNIISLYYSYDEYGNLTEESFADGRYITRDYYSINGEDGKCPADPLGMVSLLKSESYFPSKNENGESERVVEYRYQSLPRIDDVNSYFVVAISQQSDTSTIENEYIDSLSEPLIHGRLSTEKQYLATYPDSYISDVQFSYVFEDDAVKTITHVTTHDNITATTSQKIRILDGQVTESIDVDGIITESFYDELGRPISEVLSKGTEYQIEKTLAYHISGDDIYVDVTSPVGTITRTHYNNSGKETRIYQTDQDGGLYLANSFVYDAFGRAVEQSQYDRIESTEIALTTHIEYDFFDQPSRVTSPDGMVETTNTDRAQLLQTKEVVGLKREETRFDLNSQPIESKVWDAEGLLLQHYIIGHDGWGNTISTLDIEGRSSVTTYDELDRVIQTESTLDGVTLTQSNVYSHTSASDQPSEIYLNGQQLGLRTYDSLERVVEESSAGGTKSWQFSGTLPVPDVMVNPRNQELSVTYNPHLDSIEQITLQNGSERNTSYTYDPVTGNMVSHTNDASASTYAYNRQGKITSHTMTHRGDVSRTATFTYSTAGRLLSQTDYFGNVTRYDYDDYGRPSTVTTTGIGSESSIDNVTYDQYGRPSMVTTSSLGDTVLIELDYHPLGLENARTVTVNEDFLFSIEQEFNSDLMLTERRYSDGSSETTEALAYNEAGRLISYQCNGINKPCDQYGNRIAQQSFEYDIFGNVTSTETSFDDDTVNIARYHYDESNPLRLLSVTNSHPGYPEQASFDYDESGNIISDNLGYTYTYSPDELLETLTDTDGNTSFLKRDGMGNVSIEQTPSHETYLYYRGDQLINEAINDHHSYYQHGFGTVSRGVNSSQLEQHQLLIGNSMQSVVAELSKTQEGESRQALMKTYSPYGEEDLS